MQETTPLSCDIVLIGGGHAHALLLRAWGMDPLPGARLTLINPTATAPYTGMLPGFVAGHYGREDLEIDLVKLARFAGARLIFGQVTGMDRETRSVTMQGRAPIAYDYASFDIGITSDMPNLPGFAEHGVAAKPLGRFARHWRDHLAGSGGPIVVIGGGVAGVELALAIEHGLPDGTPVTVVEAENALRGVNAKTSDMLRQALERQGITLLENTTVKEVTADAVTLSGGGLLPAALTVGAAGARPFDWLNDTGLDLHDGYINVGADLRSTNDPRIFAVGDCAHLSASPRPKAGVFAVRAAPALTHNLKAVASDRPLKPFKPQASYLKLISLGGKDAVADRGKQSFGGAWAWRWKDWIDRRFMDRLNHLPAMSAVQTKTPRAVGAGTEQPLCAGCGSKVAPDILRNVLETLDMPFRPDVLTGPGADAAMLEIRGVRQALTTDHLRSFWDDPWLFGRIAALHALGDIWAMGARPQAVLCHVTLPRMTEPLQGRWLSEVMGAVAEVCEAEGAAIVGGHSTQGAEFTVGFSVTGLDAPEHLLRPSPQEGDALILTRPLGSGTLFAAEMTGQARGDDIAAALAVMTVSQGDAARALAKDARAMTDVTGFGLAGHAAHMLAEANLTAEINMDAVPLYAGALKLAEHGVRSSLWAANRADVAFEGADTGRNSLLFDPQTVGGLLAAVETHRADSLVQTLQSLRHDAAIIGHLVPREEDQPEIRAV
ncbi:MAG: selenide, water dikinase SelD [Pseudomonadota bacterium]